MDKLKKCCWNCIYLDIGWESGIDFHNYICHLKFPEPKELFGIPVTEVKIRLFDAWGKSMKEVKEKLMEMGTNCPHFKPRGEK